jgi:hypothetical protein
MRPSPTNAFEHTLVPHGDDGKTVRGIIAHCGKCDAAVPLAINSMQGHSNNDEVEWQRISRKLHEHGWEIGKTYHAHRCPKCTAVKRFDHKIEQRKAGAVNGNNGQHAMPAATHENVRVMTREDRRVIFDTLNKNYVDDTVGYAPGWTDERVSADLGVPRAWVRVIREENFGDEVSNVAIRNEISDARAVVEQINAFRPEVARLFALGDKIEKSLAEIQKVFK